MFYSLPRHEQDYVQTSVDVYKKLEHPGVLASEGSRTNTLEAVPSDPGMTLNTQTGVCV